MVSVAIILPALNEEKGVGKVLDDIKRIGKGKWVPYVVDSGSEDRTVQIAKEKGARIILVGERGKALAISTAFKMVDADYLIVMDSDATYPVSAIKLFIKALRACDVVVGSRFNGSIAKGAMSMANRIGNRCLTLLGSLLYQKPISDLCSGMWGFKKHAYQALSITCRYFELEANFFSETAKKGLKLCEIPIDYAKREGETKLRVGDGFSIAWFLITHR